MWFSSLWRLVVVLYVFDSTERNEVLDKISSDEGHQKYWLYKCSVMTPLLGSISGWSWTGSANAELVAITTKVEPGFCEDPEQPFSDLPHRTENMGFVCDHIRSAVMIY